MWGPSQWQTYRGYRWRSNHVGFGRDYDRMKPWKIEIEGARQFATFRFRDQARKYAQHLIDQIISRLGEAKEAQ